MAKEHEDTASPDESAFDYSPSITTLLKSREVPTAQVDVKKEVTEEEVEPIFVGITVSQEKDLVAGRFRIFPDRPLPHLNTNMVKAYEAEDQRDKNRTQPLFAMLFELSSRRDTQRSHWNP